MIFLRTRQQICILLVAAGCCLFLRLPLSAQQSSGFRDPSSPVALRVRDLLTQLTPAEKVSLLGYRSRPVERLSIPAYNWWNEALHGVARAGEATVFPPAIGLAATFNDELLQQAATYISTSRRAKYSLHPVLSNPPK